MHEGSKSTDTRSLLESGNQPAMQGEGAARVAASAAPSGFAEMEPRQAFLRKNVPRWFKRGGIIECADVKMHFD
jgi:hypothetical protein